MANALWFLPPEGLAPAALIVTVMDNPYVFYKVQVFFPGFFCSFFLGTIFFCILLLFRYCFLYLGIFLGIRLAGPMAQHADVIIQGAMTYKDQ